MAGEVASLLFSRMTVPILYYLKSDGKRHICITKTPDVGSLKAEKGAKVPGQVFFSDLRLPIADLCPSIRSYPILFQCLS